IEVVLVMVSEGQRSPDCQRLHLLVRCASVFPAYLINFSLLTRSFRSAAPRCCVPTIKLSNPLPAGKIYQVNQDAVNGGRDGCDPPWGFIVNSNNQFPGYCCREAGGQEAQGANRRGSSGLLEWVSLRVTADGKQ
ncbi:hypothetical protein PG997_014815, partial [Apiospora hydei]